MERLEEHMEEYFKGTEMTMRDAMLNLYVHCMENPRPNCSENIQIAKAIIGFFEDEEEYEKCADLKEIIDMKGVKLLES